VISQLVIKIKKQIENISLINGGAEAPPQIISNKPVAKVDSNTNNYQ
jgi:hypothetical protein